MYTEEGVGGRAKRLSRVLGKGGEDAMNGPVLDEMKEEGF